MAVIVLVLGESGTGKSASLRNFAPDDVYLINVEGKPLPFRRPLESETTDDYQKIAYLMRQTQKQSIVIDDAQYLMANAFMRRSAEKGYDKYTEIGTDFWTLVKTAEGLPPDHIVYFMSHLDSVDGRETMKTIGKMLNEKICMEGMFSIVLKTVVQDGNYYFATRNSGHDTVKTPMGMFADALIDNDLARVDRDIREYYGFAQTAENAQKCADCGLPIYPKVTAKRTFTAQELAENSTAQYGRALCFGCSVAAKKAAKEAAHDTGSKPKKD